MNTDKIFQKLTLLANGAKYDASCASSGGVNRTATRTTGLGSITPAGVCHSFTPDGRCISLLKVLMTNYCVFNCEYCINRRENDIPRTIFTPDELVNLTIEFYKRNYIEGLFLSSGIYQNPQYTMELMSEIVRKLRLEKCYHGYIHMKAIPYCTQEQIDLAGQYVDRMSINIELPSEESLRKLAPAKTKTSIIQPMRYIGHKWRHFREERVKRTSRKTPLFVPAGQSTQLIIGATPETDLQVLKLASTLYELFALKRVYYSAYQPVNESTKALAITEPPLARENKLYQADWLLRFYGFTVDEILDESCPTLDLDLDPKSNWALRNLHLFPIDIQTAPKEMLLRVPGVGIHGIQRILEARPHCTLRPEHLKIMGIVTKRALPFLSFAGKYEFPASLSSPILRTLLLPESKKKQNLNHQLSLFGEF